MGDNTCEQKSFSNTHFFIFLGEKNREASFFRLEKKNHFESKIGDHDQSRFEQKIISLQNSFFIDSVFLWCLKATHLGIPLVIPEQQPEQQPEPEQPAQQPEPEQPKAEQPKQPEPTEAEVCSACAIDVNLRCLCLFGVFCA